MLNFCGIVTAILKMENGRNFSMSGINSGRWNQTMLNLCSIVVAILKMATGRNFSMSGINSGHHNLPTYEMSLKSDTTENLCLSNASPTTNRRWTQVWVNSSCSALDTRLDMVNIHESRPMFFNIFLMYVTSRNWLMKQSYVTYLFYQEKVERRVPVILSIGIKRAKIIDNVSRILFPISFGLFCVFYWIYYVMWHLYTVI